MSNCGSHIAWFWVTVTLLLATQELNAGDANTSFDLYDLARRASVEVLVDRHLSGSGCIVDAGGAVLTAAHVVANVNKKIEILSPIVGRLPVKQIAVDYGHDIALLQIEPENKDYPFLRCAEKMPAAGETVFLFGAPIYRHGVLVKGSVARNASTFEFVNGRYAEVSHLCASAPFGMSGGPWINGLGEVMGIQSAQMSLGGAQQGISFAAPLHSIRHFVKTRKSTRTCTIGAAVEEIWEQQPEFLKDLDDTVSGLVVRALKKDGAAASAGLKDGTVISKIDGKSVEFRDSFLRHIRALAPNETVEVTIADKDGKRQQVVTVRLELIKEESPTN